MNEKKKLNEVGCSLYIFYGLVNRSCRASVSDPKSLRKQGEGGQLSPFLCPSSSATSSVLTSTATRTCCYTYKRGPRLP